MVRMLVVGAMAVAALGCRSQTAPLTNPFMTPDRVPPPATRLPEPGAAAALYGVAPGMAATPGMAVAPATSFPAVAAPAPGLAPTTVPPATSYPGAGFPLTPATPAAAPVTPPGGWGGFQPQSSTSFPAPVPGEFQRLQAREISPAEYLQSPSSSAFAEFQPRTSDGFRPQGSASPAPTSMASAPASAIEFRQGLTGASDESTTARFAHGENYDWLRGQLEYWPDRGQWTLRYADADAGATPDGFGGRLSIENPQVLGNLPPGEYVKLRGQMFQRDSGDGTWAPAYRIAAVERQRL